MVHLWHNSYSCCWRMNMTHSLCLGNTLNTVYTWLKLQFTIDLFPLDLHHACLLSTHFCLKGTACEQCFFLFNSQVKVASTYFWARNWLKLPVVALTVFLKHAYLQKAIGIFSRGFCEQICRYYTL
jgi:hypothetical protein